MAQNRNNTDQDLAGLIEYVAKSLVDDPTQVKVKERNSNNATVIELRVASPDTGRIIGKGGRVANALRSLLRVAESENRGRRIILKIQ
jgi:uncharacterized protein